MNIQLMLKALKDHVDEEVRIHKEIFSESDKGVKDLLEKHLNDTMKIHKSFWRKLKKLASNDK